jgi:hypothetical protein
VNVISGNWFGKLREREREGEDKTHKQRLSKGQSLLQRTLPCIKSAVDLRSERERKEEMNPLFMTEEVDKRDLITQLKGQ